MISNYLPQKLKNPVCSALSKINTPQEVRFRANQNIVIVNSDREFFVEASGEVSLCENNCLKVSPEDLRDVFQMLVSNSVYAAKEDLKKGFITINGGHRAGLCGKGVILNDNIEYIKDISSINIRIAREIKGCGNKIIDVINKENVKNTLIISPPGCGKTTILRDVARQLSDYGYNISIVDERCEIAPMINGVPIFDIGKRSDVLTDCPKARGMMMVLRTMNPQIIITDEIGTKEDVSSLLEISRSGVKVIASFHGYSMDDFVKRTDIKDLFELIVILSKNNGVGTIEEVVC